MNPVPTALALPAAIPWRVAPPLISTALIMIGGGFLGTLLPLRFSAPGMSDGVIGLYFRRQRVLPYHTVSPGEAQPIDGAADTLADE